MSEELDPVVFAVLAEVQTAIAAVMEVADAVRTMAAEVASSVAEITASNAKMSASYAESAAKIRDESASIGESTHKAGLGFKQMAEMAGLFAAADFLKESVKVAADGAQAQAILAQSIRDTGQAYNEGMGKAVESVDSQMRAFGFTNAQTNQQMAIMIQTTRNAKEGMNLMGLAADVAAGRHMSLERATRLVSMAASGHVAMLARMGIQTKDATGKTLTAKEAIDRLAQSFRGQAAVAAGTAAGQFKAFSAQLDDAKEKIGNALIPVLTALLPVILSIVQSLATFLVPILKVAAAFFQHFGGVIKMLIPVLVAVIAVNKLQKLSWDGVKEAMEKVPLMLIIAGITMLVEWLIHAWNTSQGFRNGVIDAFNAIAKTVGQVVAFILGLFKDWVDAQMWVVQKASDGISWFAGIFGIDLSGAKKFVDNFVNGTNAAMDGWIRNAKGWGNIAHDAFGKVGQSAKDAHAAMLGAGPTNISSGFSNLVTNLPQVQHVHRQHLQRHHSNVQNDLRKHYEALLAMAREQARKQEALLKAQLAATRAQLAAARNALKHDAKGDIEIVNGMLANVGTSLLNLGYAGQGRQQVVNVNVNVSGSVTTHQNLVSSIQQGLLVGQRTNSSLGIVGKT